MSGQRQTNFEPKDDEVKSLLQDVVEGDIIILCVLHSLSCSRIPI
jgi:hypothetical protein